MKSPGRVFVIAGSNAKFCVLSESTIWHLAGLEMKIWERETLQVTSNMVARGRVAVIQTHPDE